MLLVGVNISMLPLWWCEDKSILFDSQRSRHSNHYFFKISNRCQWECNCHQSMWIKTTMLSVRGARKDDSLARYLICNNKTPAMKTHLFYSTLGGHSCAPQWYHFLISSYTDHFRSHLQWMPSLKKDAPWRAVLSSDKPIEYPKFVRCFLCEWPVKVFG